MSIYNTLKVGLSVKEGFFLLSYFDKIMDMEIYLIASDSYKLVKEQVNKITGESLNVIKYNLKTSSIEEAISEANYFSLLDEHKYVIIHSDDLFKTAKKEENKSDSTKDVKIIEDCFQNGNEKCTLVFTSYEMPDKRKKLYKMITEKGHVIVIEPLNKKDLTYKCMDLLKNKGYVVDYETASYIVDNSYVNYDIMTNELEKIYTLLPAKKTTKEDLENIISTSLTNTTFGFINAVINRDLRTAIDSSKNFERLKIEPSMVLIMLAKEFQIMNLLKGSMSSREVQNMFRKEDWQMKNYLLNADKYTKKELKKIIIRLADYDYKLKSGLLDKSIILELLTMELCE